MVLVGRILFGVLVVSPRTRGPFIQADTQVVNDLYQTGDMRHQEENFCG
jgi:hypothetical protein